MVGLGNWEKVNLCLDVRALMGIYLCSISRSKTGQISAAHCALAVKCLWRQEKETKKPAIQSCTYDDDGGSYRRIVLSSFMRT